MKDLKVILEELRNLARMYSYTSYKSRNSDTIMLLQGRAEGLSHASIEIEEYITQLSLEAHLSNLRTENIECDSRTGFILPSEIVRIRLRYGVYLRGDYNFLRTQEFRLVDGAKLVF